MILYGMRTDVENLNSSTLKPKATKEFAIESHRTETENPKFNDDEFSELQAKIQEIESDFNKAKMDF